MTVGARGKRNEFVSDEPAGLDRGDGVRRQANTLSEVHVNDCSILGIEVDLFNVSDRNPGDENLASGFEPPNVRKSCFHLVGGTEKGNTRAGLYCKPDNRGGAAPDTRADPEVDSGWVQSQIRLSVERGRPTDRRDLRISKWRWEQCRSAQGASLGILERKNHLMINVRVPKKT